MDSIAFGGLTYGRQRFALSTPQVISVTPNSGNTGGGTSITIQGKGFIFGCAVTIDGNEAGSIVFVSPTELTCTTPTGIVGVKDIVVTNPDGGNSGSSGNRLFTYVPSPAALTSMSRTLGDSIGGVYSDVIMEPNPILINGSGFNTATQVLFDGVSTAFSIVNDSQISVSAAPGHVPGVIDVVVVNAGGTSNALSYEYWSPAATTPRGFWDGSPINSSAIAANRWSYYGWAGAPNAIFGTGAPAFPDTQPGCPYFLGDGRDGDTVGSGRISNRYYQGTHGTTALGGYPSITANAPLTGSLGYATFVRGSGHALYFSNGGWPITDWIGTGDCSVAMVVDLNGSIQIQANDSNANALMNDSNLAFGIMLGGLAGDQAVFLFYDGTSTRKVRATLPATHGRLVIMARRNANVLQLSFDGITWVSGDTCTGPLTSYGFSLFGLNYANPAAGSFDGRLRALSAWATSISDADAQKFVAWATARHP